MQRKAMVVVVCIFLVGAALGVWLLVGNPLPAEASAARQEERRALTIDEFTLLNQPGPLWLVGIDLSQSNLHTVKLAQALLQTANLRGALLIGANLSSAIVYGADLSDADLSNASLHRANLSDAILVGANLSDTDLTNATYSAAAKWPQDFDPAAAGAVLADQELPQTFD